jgi:hypothetical protein
MIKHKILNCLQEDSGSSGLSIDDIATKIDNKDISIIKDLVQELFSEGKLIESSHSTKSYKKYRVEKPGQDLLGN